MKVGLIIAATCALLGTTTTVHAAPACMMKTVALDSQTRSATTAIVSNTTRATFAAAGFTDTLCPAELQLTAQSVVAICDSVLADDDRKRALTVEFGVTPETYCTAATDALQEQAQGQ